MEIGSQYTPLQGINNGFERLADSAHQMANPDRSSEIAENLIETQQASTQVQTSAKALKTTDDNIGTLLDIMA